MTPRLPRDLSGPELIRALERQGYVVTRVVGSQARVPIQDLPSTT